MSWDQLVNTIQKSSACKSLLLNLILIWLIVKKSPAEIGSYRYLMIYTAFFEIVYSFVDVLISPVLYSHDSMILVIVSTKSPLLSKNVLLILDCVWCGFLGIFMMLFSMQFVYRYFVVVGSKSIESFKDYRIIYWIMLPIISGTAWGAVVYFFMGPRKQTDNYLRDVLLNQLNLVYEETTYIGPRCYYQNANGDLMIDTYSIISIVYLVVVMVISLSCITYCATRTFCEIRTTLKVSTMESRNFNRIQSQTFYALVTQALVPVLLLHLPCSYVLVAAMMDIDLGHSSSIVSITIALFPALDPLPVMLIIQNYRLTLFSLVKTPAKVFARQPTISTPIA